MKTSEALIKGFEKVGGKQCRNTAVQLRPNGKHDSYCMMGAINAAEGRRPYSFSNRHNNVVAKIFGEGIITLNDGMDYKMDWRDVVGILQSEGK